MSSEETWNFILGWTIRLAGLFWLLGAFMLVRQIRMEMALDKVTRALTPSPTDRDNAARRGWIAGQAVVLTFTAIAMIMLHPFASGLVALLVLGQGVYFIWRESIARRAPDAEAAAHARPSAATINAGWVSLTIACLVWMAAWRGVLH